MKFKNNILRIKSKCFQKYKHLVILLNFIDQFKL